MSYTKNFIIKYSKIYPDPSEILPLSSPSGLKDKCLDFDLDKANFIRNGHSHSHIKNKPVFGIDKNLDIVNTSPIDYYDDIMMPRNLAKRSLNSNIGTNIGVNSKVKDLHINYCDNV